METNKIPFTKCNEKTFNYIKPKLESWGYIFKGIDNIKTYCYFVINTSNNLGSVTNFYFEDPLFHTDYNRYYEPNIEIFLQKAAKLKGYNYKRKDIVYPEDLTGNISNFPIEIVQHMVNEQVHQGNLPDVTIFQHINAAGTFLKGFNWRNTKEGEDFWHAVIRTCNFDLYFKKYPKQTNMEQFTKENLQSGMIVELRNGIKCLVVNNRETCFLLSINDYYLLDNYTNNLESCVKDFDIIKVYTHRCTGTLKFILEHNKHKLIWQRKVVITKQEIADKFGVNINDIEINE